MEPLAPALHRLDTATLADRALAALLAHIRAERMRPGMGLPSEAKLTELLGVSRPVVREALRNLRGLGVIDIFNGRGAVVRELSPASLEVFFSHALQTVDQSLIELMDLRTGLECEAAALAAERRSATDVAALQALVAEMRAVTADAHAYSRLDADLHVAIARATGNRLYLQMVQSIRVALQQASLAGMRIRLERREVGLVHDMHEAIVSHIIAQAPEAAASEMRRHMRMATDMFTAEAASGAM